MVLDVSTPVLYAIVVEGHLRFDDAQGAAANIHLQVQCPCPSMSNSKSATATALPTHMYS